jgi:hypothetical protein
MAEVIDRVDLSSDGLLISIKLPVSVATSKVDPIGITRFIPTTIGASESRCALAHSTTCSCRRARSPASKSRSGRRPGIAPERIDRLSFCYTGGASMLRARRESGGLWYGATPFWWTVLGLRLSFLFAESFRS